MSKNWHIPRRRFLRGLGTAIALPMLEAMAPSVSALAAAAGDAATRGKPGGPTRMAFVYLPNGHDMANWTPKGTGENYELPQILEPLRAHQKDLMVITGLAQKHAEANGDGAGDHARASATFLTGCQARKTAGADIKVGISVDQIAANRIGHETRLPSLELTCDQGRRSGECDSGYACVYQFNIAWRSENQPLNPEPDPKQAFDRLFAGANRKETKEARAKRELYDKSVLDAVLEDARGLQANLGTTDRRKLDEYLTAIRDIENRVAQSANYLVKVPMGDQHIPKDYSFEQHIRLMYDLQVLAFQSDITRISTFLVAHDGSNRTYPTVGVPEEHHELSHHGGKEEKKAKLAKINRFHTTQFAYFLERLKAVKEGEGTLLDNCMIVYGSGISDGDAHNHDNLPVLLAGRGGGTIQTGRHLKLDGRVPMNNLYLSMLERMRAPIEHFGDSTGLLKGLA